MPGKLSSNRRRIRLGQIVFVGLAALVLAACPEVTRPEPDLGPLDPTDYQSDRSLVAEFYAETAADYWVEHGIPNSARLSLMIDANGGDPLSAFDALRAAFLEEALGAALETGELSAQLERTIERHLAAARDLEDGYFLGLRDLVAQRDDEAFSGSANEQLLAEIDGYIREAATIALDRSVLASMVPASNKEFLTPPPENPDAVCPVGSDAFSPAEETVVDPTDPPRPGDSSTTATTTWDKISRVLWDTTYNGSCTGQSAGPCAVKLGLMDKDVSCKDWNDFSKELGATPGKAGAPMSGIADYFKSKGYCVSKAWDGPSESACEEAKAALDRGCDVLLYYKNDANTRAHLEMVTGMSIDGTDDEKCAVTTSSWGSAATTTYDSGRYSGKSDGRNYRKATESKSYLEGEGSATFYYYCPCD